VQGRRSGVLQSIIAFVVIVGTGAALILDVSGFDACTVGRELWDKASRQAFTAKGYVTGRFGKEACEAEEMPAKLETRLRDPDPSAGGRLVEYQNNTGEPLLVRLYRGSGGPLEASVLVGAGERTTVPGMSKDDQLVVQMPGSRWCGGQRGWADGQVVEVDVGGWQHLMALRFGTTAEGELRITPMPWEVPRAIARAERTAEAQEQPKSAVGQRVTHPNMLGGMGDLHSKGVGQQLPQQGQGVQGQEARKVGAGPVTATTQGAWQPQAGGFRQQAQQQVTQVKKLALQPSQTEIENAKRARERAVLAAMAPPATAAEANEQAVSAGSVRTQDWRDVPPREIRLVTNGSRLYVGGKVGDEDVQFLLRTTVSRRSAKTWREGLGRRSVKLADG
jgi:hypothetical protein